MRAWWDDWGKFLLACVSMLVILFILVYGAIYVDNKTRSVVMGTPTCVCSCPPVQVNVVGEREKHTDD